MVMSRCRRRYGTDRGRGSHLQVLPAAAAGQILHYEAVIGADRWAVPVPASPAPIATFQGNKHTQGAVSRRRERTASNQPKLHANISISRWEKETEGKRKRRKDFKQFNPKSP